MEGSVKLFNSVMLFSVLSLPRVFNCTDHPGITVQFLYFVCHPFVLRMVSTDRDHFPSEFASQRPAIVSVDRLYYKQMAKMKHFDLINCVVLLSY